MRSSSRTKSKRPTLRDIAKLAGCSVQTVSCILNPDSASTTNFSDSLRAETERIAFELGYQARGVRSGSRQERATLLIIAESTAFALPYISREYGLLSPHDLPWEYNRHIRVSDAESEASGCRELEEIEALVSTMSINGIICLHHANHRLLELCERLRIPVVFVNPNRTLERNCILPNDQGGVHTAMRYLQSAGVRRVAYVGGRIHPKWRHQSIGIRRKAVQEAAADFGLDLIYCVTEGDRSEREQVEDILDLGLTEPTMIVSYADFGNSLAESRSIWSRLGEAFPNKLDFLCLSDTKADCCAWLRLNGALQCELALQRVLLMGPQHQTAFDNILLGEQLEINRPPFTADEVTGDKRNSR